MTVGAQVSAPEAASATTPVLLPSLSLVLPAHNEAENLAWLVPHIAAVMPSLCERAELIVVDDGSTDGGAEVARRAAAAAGLEISVIRHAQKSGYGITVADGLRAARCEYVAFTDADGQFEVADLRRLIPLLEDADFVGGYRLGREDAAFRSVIALVFKLCLRGLYGLNVRDVDCAMKLMRREVLESFVIENRSAVMNAELYIKARARGWRISQVGVPHHARVAGVRSGARPRAIARAVKELLLFRVRLWAHGLR